VFNTEASVILSLFSIFAYANFYNLGLPTNSTMMIGILFLCVVVILWDILDSDVSLHHLQYTECFVDVMEFMKLKWRIYANDNK
jgi:hypothetical protein